MAIEFEVPPPVGAQHPLFSALRAQLVRILGSEGFLRSDRIADFLSFLFERSLLDQAYRPKEALLGVEIFGREMGYDTQADPVVRVTARRLRSKLWQYYQGPGKNDPVRIELPLGSYALKFSFLDHSGEPAASGIDVPAVAVAPALPLIGSGKALFDHFYMQRPSADDHESHACPCTPSHPAFSPDGRAIAFDWRGPEDAAEGIYVQYLDADRPARFSSSTVKEFRPAWSPDGGRIAFIREIEEGRFEVRTAPTLGRGERLLAEITTRSGTAPRVGWSPDAKVLVTSGRGLPKSADALLLILLEGGAIQEITVPPPGCLGDDDAIFSPAGGMLAFRRRTGARTGDVYLHPMTSDLAERRLTWDDCEIHGIAWAPGGDSLIIASHREGDTDSLWRISLSNHPPERLTGTNEAVRWPAVSHRADLLAYVRQPVDSGGGDSGPAAGQIMVATASGLAAARAATA